jgi:hypothetical protein
MSGGLIDKSSQQIHQSDKKAKLHQTKIGEIFPSG